MAEHLKVMDYHDDEMKLHRFIRWLQMPVTFVAMAALLVIHWDEYRESTHLIIEAVLCIVGMLLIAITEFGFIYNASYSYFSVLLYFVNNVSLSVFYLGYNYLFTAASNQVVMGYAGSTLGTLIVSILIYFYYLRRKYLFVESKEEKRIKGAGLKPTEIDFNPKFEHERMSRGELKEHMEKRFEEVDKSTQTKKDERKEANPFDDD